jgi:hypothetical protein
MSLSGLLRHRRAGHVDPLIRDQVDHVSAEAVYAIGQVDPRQPWPAAISQLVGALTVAIGDPAVSEAAESKLREIRRAKGVQS